MVSVKDFGAVGDGICDDYSAIQRSLDSGESEIYIPMGIYCVSETLLVHSGTTVIADKGAKIVMQSKRVRRRNEFLLSNSDVVGGNRDIKIIGGIWDGNNSQPENAKPDLFDKNGYSGTVLNFVSVDGLELRDIVVANSTTFYIRVGHLCNFVMEDITFVSDQRGRNQDGIHFGGDVKHGRVRNLRSLTYGQTTDDMVALNADDCIERVENLDLTRDAIEDITFENIFAESCHTVIRMLSVTAPIRNIRFKNIFAGFCVNAINADAARRCATPIFKDEDYPQGVGAISDIVLENMTVRPVRSPEKYGDNYFPYVALRMETDMDNFHIKNFHYIADEETMEKCPALIARNLTHNEIIADGAVYTIGKKDDVVTVKNLKNLEISIKK